MPRRWSSIRSRTLNVADPVRSWDDYFIPGTEVLQNRLGIVDADELQAAETKIVAVRLAGIALAPVTGHFDFAHFKAIHRRLFKDVYAWAGQVRTAPWLDRMTKSAPDVVDYRVGDPAAPLVSYGYFPASLIENAQIEQHTKLAGEKFLRGLSRVRFAERLADYWNELNAIHAFREGNTRTQFVFFSQLAQQAGWPLDPRFFVTGQPLADQFVAARFYGQATGNPARLADVLLKSIPA